MPKKIITVFLLTTSLVILGGCSLFKSEQNNQKTNDTTGDATAGSAESSADSTSETADAPTPAAPIAEIADGTEEEITGSIQDLIARGTPMKCVFKSGDEKFSMTGTAYVTKNLARQKVVLKASGDIPLNRQTNNIFDPEWMYNWTEGETTGTKTSTKAFEASLKEFADKYKDVPLQPTPTEPSEKDYTFKCTRWTVDKSLFEPPANVTFTEEDMNQPPAGAGTSGTDPLKELLNNAPSPEQIQQIKDTACAACVQAQDPDACRADVGCE